MIASGALAGGMTGIMLGLFGSGGAIIIVPALLYLLHLDSKQAIAMGLGIVALTATVSALDNWRRGNVNLKVASVFGLFGMAGTYAGARLGAEVPAALQLGLFAVVMYAAAWRMLRGGAPKAPADASDRAPHGSQPVADRNPFVGHRLGRIALVGVAVGILAGLVGVGGGFLIVPALVLLSGIPMKQAVGTSLAIVALNSYAGFAGYLGTVPMDYPLLGAFAAITIAGSLVGTRLAHRFSHDGLKRAFGMFLPLVATYILVKSVL
jgi:uncharacterized membrane protein YfcA